MPPTDPADALSVSIDRERLRAQCSDEIQRVLNEHETELRRTGRLAAGAAAPTAGLADWLAGPIIQKVLAAVLAQLKPMLTDFIDKLFAQVLNQQVPAPQPGGTIPVAEAAPASASAGTAKSRPPA